MTTMFGNAEHAALMRLMRYALGFVPDSRRIAHWLQAWERAEDPRDIPDHVSGLATDHARDVRLLAQAAQATWAKPSTLGRREYVFNMENIARAHPLPAMEFER
ncbi:hypothetical protein [Crenobacter luteus]|nr:hypothetical protein [Crenobacter luteus]